MAQPNIVHEFEKDGKRYRFVHDDTHETRGSYAYDTEAETKAAEDEEIAKLASGEWIAVGLIVDRECQETKHCHSCNGREGLDSVWGIVIEPDAKKLEAFALEQGI